MARGVVVEVALNLLHLPLVGFVRVCPSSDILRSRPLPATLPLPSASQRYTGRLVPSSWFRTTSTVYSALEVPGLLHPGTGRGSPRFHPALPLAAQSSEEDRLASGQSQRFPAAPFTPPEEVPPPVAVLHRCSRCPLVVAPVLRHETSSCELHRPSTSRRCSTVGSVAPALRCRLTCALSFHGLRSPPGCWASEANQPNASPHRLASPWPPVPTPRCREPGPPPPLPAHRQAFA
jgi:hypothetical protein